MIRYLLMVFGINCNNKWIGNFLTGFTLFLFSLVVIPIIFPISLNDELKVLILKIFCSLTTASKIISILIIKFNSSKIVRLYDQIEEYQIKSFIKHKYYFSTTISILTAFITSGFTTTIYYYDFYFNKLFKEFTETQELLPINQKLQIILIHFYLHAWKTLLELMYRDFNTRYISIIESFIQELNRNVNEPDRDVIINAQRTVLQLTQFQSNFKKHFNFIEYFIFVDIFSISGIMIYALIYVPTFNLNFNILSISNLILMSIHSLWTFRSGFKAKYLSEELMFKLNRWKEMRIEGFCFIEMQVLERTVQIFKGNENNEAIDSL